MSLPDTESEFVMIVPLRISSGLSKAMARPHEIESAMLEYVLQLQLCCVPSNIFRAYFDKRDAREGTPIDEDALESSDLE